MSFLLSTPHGYYFRIAVPADLRESIGIKSKSCFSFRFACLVLTISESARPHAQRMTVVQPPIHGIPSCPDSGGLATPREFLPGGHPSIEGPMTRWGRCESLAPCGAPLESAVPACWLT